MGSSAARTLLAAGTGHRHRAVTQQSGALWLSKGRDPIVTGRARKAPSARSYGWCHARMRDQGRAAGTQHAAAEEAVSHRRSYAAAAATTTNTNAYTNAIGSTLIIVPQAKCPRRRRRGCCGRSHCGDRSRRKCRRRRPVVVVVVVVVERIRCWGRRRQLAGEQLRNWPEGLGTGRVNDGWRWEPPHAACGLVGLQLGRRGRRQS